MAGALVIVVRVTLVCDGYGLRPFCPDRATAEVDATVEAGRIVVRDLPPGWSSDRRRSRYVFGEEVLAHVCYRCSP